ncbi:MAG: formylglycine-generating enzyme family protein [Chloroflexi bacterium]|nr:formylglycine-generating enzyme family protein [Chloroflexota bacterium]
MKNFFGKQWKLGWIISLVLLVVILVLVFLNFKSGSKTAAPAQVVATLAPTEAASAALETAPAATAEPTPVATETAALDIGSARTSEIDGMEQVFVPAGEFLMGTNDTEAKITVTGGRAYPEVPQFTYSLDAFWIDKLEVTNSQYAACIAAGACTEPHNLGFSPNLHTDYFTNPAFSNYPVVWVNWFQARDYCTWAGRRLPTEAEWEKASRGTDGQKYPWGNDPVTGDRANFCDVNCTRTIANPIFNDGYADVAPVGSFPLGASPYGALDMSGNVWEWTSTLIMDYPYVATDGREDPNTLGERVWKGGPWSNGIWWMRSSVRYRALDIYSWYVLGLRCVATP